MNSITKSCLFCQKPFQAPVKELKRGNGKFCSQSCSARHHQTSIPPKEPNVKCALCEKAFYKNVSRQKLSKSKLYFCSRNHKDLAQRIGGIEAIQPDHYNNGIYNYREQAFRALPYKCNRCNYNEKRILVVHHKDHDRDNNDILNLEILCPNCHAIEHWFPDQK